MNASDVKSKLGTPGGRAERLAKSNSPSPSKVRELYLAAFSREPRADELKVAEAYVARPRVDAARQAARSRKGQAREPTKTCSGRSSTPKNSSTTTKIMHQNDTRPVSSLGMMGFWLGATSLAQEVVPPRAALAHDRCRWAGRRGPASRSRSRARTSTGERLLFSHPEDHRETEGFRRDGKPETNTFVVTIAADAPPGVHDARVLSRLGVSSARAFSVGALPEVTRVKPNTSMETALELKPNSICNAVMTRGRSTSIPSRPRRDSASWWNARRRGIDSKLNPVLIIADAKGRDLLADRRGGLLDFKAPGRRHVFRQGPRPDVPGRPRALLSAGLARRTRHRPRRRAARDDDRRARSRGSRRGSKLPKVEEAEPNDRHAQAQKITLPCEIEGRFYPAADVDTFEFAAKKGEVWWVEVASERLGLPTDPFVLVQRVTREGPEEKLDDVAEFNDIPSPIKPSSNGYSYDGPVYDAGSADPLGKLEIKEDGVYRLQVRDLFGGTRSEPRHVYRLIIRKRGPRFRPGRVGPAYEPEERRSQRTLQADRAPRRGTMALGGRGRARDGFDGEIELGMSDLPEGVSACGLKIPAGKSVGTLLISAAEDAPRSLGIAKIFGRAQIDGKTVTRPGRLASMAWPVKDASQEIPNPRLVADVPVSVSRSEGAPVTIAPAENKVWEVKAGDKLTIPLKVTWRSEFTGTSIKLSPMGADFKGVKAIDVPLKAAGSRGRARPGGLEDPARRVRARPLRQRRGQIPLQSGGREAGRGRAEEGRARSDRHRGGRQEARRRSEGRTPDKKSEAENAAKAADRQAEVGRGRQGGRRQTHEGRDRCGVAQGHRRYRGGGTHSYSRHAQGSEMSAPPATTRNPPVVRRRDPRRLVVPDPAPGDRCGNRLLSRRLSGPEVQLHRLPQQDDDQGGPEHGDAGGDAQRGRLGRGADPRQRRGEPDLPGRGAHRGRRDAAQGKQERRRESHARRARVAQGMDRPGGQELGQAGAARRLAAPAAGRPADLQRGDDPRRPARRLRPGESDLPLRSGDPAIRHPPRG